MKRLVFIVEGDTELIFVHHCLIPYLVMKGFSNPMNAQKILTNRKLNAKGGNVGFEYLKNEISRVAATGNVLITTMLDFFRLPNDFPCYTTESRKVSDIEAGIRESLSDIVNPSFFLPYIQLHEIEALMYSNMDGFKVVVDEDDKLNKLQHIIDEFPNPEDIDGGSETAPSKRLRKIFPYNKVADGQMILEALTIDQMRSKCPHFNFWVTKLEEGLRNDNF